MSCILVFSDTIVIDRRQSVNHMFVIGDGLMKIVRYKGRKLVTRSHRKRALFRAHDSSRNTHVAVALMRNCIFVTIGMNRNSTFSTFLSFLLTIDPVCSGCSCC